MLSVNTPKQKNKKKSFIFSSHMETSFYGEKHVLLSNTHHLMSHISPTLPAYSETTEVK